MIGQITDQINITQVTLASYLTLCETPCRFQLTDCGLHQTREELVYVSALQGG